MSRMVTLRMDDDLLDEIDRQRQRAGLTRARVLREALDLWVRRRRLGEAVRRHREGYQRAPVRAGEFSPVLGAARWPK
jgi:metal-responsive CopG/Arc/MetJ family transcriptional regulator